MVLGKKVAIFGWEWGRNMAPRDRQKKALQIVMILFAVMSGTL